MSNKKNFILLILLSFSLVSCLRKNPPSPPENAKDQTILEQVEEKPQSCKPQTKLEQSDCLEGFICVPVNGNPSLGICRKDCGKNLNGKLVKSHSICASDKHHCMLFRRDDLIPIGMFCGRPEQKDTRCEAALDEDACLNGLSCLPTAHYTNEQGQAVFGRNRCKQECSDEKPCGIKEQCLLPSYARKGKQHDAITGKTQVNCSFSSCQKEGSPCPCDKTKGFNCESLVEGLDEGICVRSLGVCGEPVKLALLSDFKGDDFLGETCNELDDTRICETLGNKELSTSNVLCQPINKDHEGLCIAPCSMPAFEEPANNNRSSIDCPTGYSCTTDLARKLNFHMFMEKDGQEKTCNPLNCKEKTPCPTECGQDGECLTVENDGQKHFICGAPIGTCALKSN